jgi:hypothetical protein
MPRLPDIADMSRPVPRAQRQIVTDPSGQIVGRALKDAGAQGAALVHGIEAREDQENYAQARSALLQADIATRQSLEDDPDYSTYDSRYREAMQKARDTARQGIRSRYDLAAFNRDADLDMARGAAAVAGLARQKSVDVGRATLDTTITNNRTAALDATDEATRSALVGATHEAITGAQAKGYITAQEAVNTRQKWTADYAEGFLETQSPDKRLSMLQNPKGTPADFLPADIRARLGEQAQRELKQQQVAAQAVQADSIANSVLGTYAKAGPDAGSAELAKLQKSGLSEDVLATVYGKVSTGVSRMRDIQQQAHADDLAGLYATIESKNVGPESFLTVDKLWQAGALSPLEKASLIGRIEGAHLSGAQDTALATTVRQALATGTPLDPSSSDQRKAITAAFTQDAQGAAVGSDSWQSLASAYAARTRMLPDPAASWVRSAIRSPDPKVAAPAIQFFGSIAAQSPDATSGFDTQTKAFAGMANSMIEAGTPAEKAIEVARQTTLEQNPAVIKQREEAYRKTTDSDSALDNYIDRDFDPSLFSSQPSAPTGLKLDFSQQAGRYFQYTGDIQSARDLAWQDIKRVYGVSEVNGTKQMMVLPPERFGVKPEEIRADLDGATKGPISVDDAMKSVQRAELTPAQEKDYRSWLDRIGMTREKGFRLDSNYTGEDYDLRGFFKKYGPADVNVAGGQHFTDEFKLPNHETFSNQSIYATGSAAALAGRWNGDTYVPASKQAALKLPEGTSTNDVVLVPDSLTMRSVNDIMSGKPAMPSYKLLTKTGELLLDDHGVPLRYTLPSSEDLSVRLRAAQAKATEQAQQQITQARFDRDTTRRRREVYPEGSH